jgi:regulation of enolase protein 1 (concanavalin A-like superfamily)
VTISWGAMTWVNQPRQWSRDGPDLSVRTEAYSDFWRTTGVGYDRDSGHAFLAREQGDLTAQVSVGADFSEQHDEAGLMIRLNERTWIKAGVQLVGDALVAVVVSTRDTSDLSITPLPGLTEGQPVQLRLEREGNAVRVLCSPSGQSPQLLRLAAFPPGVPLGVGPMCCSPRRGGLDVRFTACSIETRRPSWAWLT